MGRAAWPAETPSARSHGARLVTTDARERSGPAARRLPLRIVCTAMPSASRAWKKIVTPRGHAEVGRAVRLDRHRAQHELARIVARQAHVRIVHVGCVLGGTPTDPQSLDRAARRRRPRPRRRLASSIRPSCAPSQATAEATCGGRGRGRTGIGRFAAKSPDRGRSGSGCRRRRTGTGPVAWPGSGMPSRRGTPG